MGLASITVLALSSGCTSSVHMALHGSWCGEAVSESGTSVLFPKVVASGAWDGAAAADGQADGVQVAAVASAPVDGTVLSAGGVETVSAVCGRSSVFVECAGFGCECGSGVLTVGFGVSDKGACVVLIADCAVPAAGATDLACNPCWIAAGVSCGRATEGAWAMSPDPVSRGGAGMSGYSMRSWNTPVSTVEKALHMVSRLLNVRSDSSSCPLLAVFMTSLRISALILSESGLGTLRVAASMVSASITTAASRLLGRGPS